MTRPRVTPAERQAARLQDLDKARLTRIGIDAAIRIGARIQRVALAAWKRGDNPGPAARAALDEALPLLIDGMVAADMTGRRRVVLSTPGSLSLRAVTSAYDAAVAAMRKRLDMPLSELDKLRLRYNASALEVLKNTGDIIEKKLQATMVEIVTGGEHVKSGRAMLADAFDAMGITPDNSFTLEGIFRTQTALAYGAGRWQLEQDPAVQEILWGYKYVTVGDDRVRPEHVGFEGVTLPKDDPFWSYAYPPNGFNCRCVAIPLYEPTDESNVPKQVEVDGKMVQPAVDKGFAFNPGQVLGV